MIELHNPTARLCRVEVTRQQCLAILTLLGCLPARSRPWLTAAFEGERVRLYLWPRGGGRWMDLYALLRPFGPVPCEAGTLVQLERRQPLFVGSAIARRCGARGV